jgi:hypothetical protein
MPLLGWALVLFGPAVCAGAGAVTAWLALRGRYDRQADRVWDDGYREGYARAEAFSGTMVADYPAVVIHRPPAGAHAGLPADSPAVTAHLALADVASEFDRIRAEFGLDGIEGPAPSRAAELARLADPIGPPSGELLRAAGIATGAPWPRAPRPE